MVKPGSSIHGIFHARVLEWGAIAFSKVEIKPQLKPRGSVAKEEDPKPSHQLYKLQIKSAQSTKQILCLWNMSFDEDFSLPLGLAL